MNDRLRWLGGLGVGAGLMYLMDADRGRRRRALARDRVVSSIGGARDFLGKTARDARNRAQGALAQAGSRIRSNGPPNDRVLAERVRSKIGRHVSHPGSIDVEARRGRVILRGPVLADETDDLVRTVASVRGVESVENRLEVHREPGDVPGLQGEGRARGETAEYLQENWSPAARLLAGVAGGSLALFGLRSWNKLGAAAATVGTGLLLRGATNRPVRRLTGVGAGRRAVDLQKTITVDAPLDEVYELWSRFENFPRFMSHIQEVRDLGNDRSRWTASLPAGMSISWNAVVTARVPGEVLAWRSEPGSTVESAGIVRFEPVDVDSTRLDIQMSYNPPAGAIGNLVAGIMGADPKSAMDEDLVRFKSLLEEGRATAKGETVRREELGGEPDEGSYSESGYPESLTKESFEEEGPWKRPHGDIT